MALRRIDAVQEASGDGWQARKHGKTVELRISGLGAGASETLPTEFTPTAQTYIPVSAQSTTSAYTPRIAVTVNGAITTQGYTGRAYGITTYRTA